MKKSLIILSLLIISSSLLFSQNIEIIGRAIDSKSNRPLISASVQLFDKDSVTKYHALTDNRGFFKIKNIAPEKYILKITYIGYKTYFKNLNLKTKQHILKLGNLAVKPKDVELNEVEVNAQSVIGEQHGDTTQFNANSFKTLKDATAEELIRKMPGIEIDPSGKVKAQGEEVKKVFVDGKKFFGDDPSLALKNLPAEIINKVQIYDKSSDQAEFTGFDDGERNKTINLITRKSKRHGEFGKFSAGGGYENKYQFNANYNIFNGAQRISILGMANNVNQQNFSILDILNMTGSHRGRMLRRIVSSGASAAIGSRINFAVRRSGASTFYGGLQDGISTTYAAGINYADMWADNLEINGSYFFNYGDNTNNQITNRDYLASFDSTTSFNENDNSNSINTNHRFNFRLDWDLDSNNSFMLKPNFTFQTNQNFSNAASQTMLTSGDTSNAALSDYHSNNTGYNLNNTLLYKHRFAKPGRTVSFNLSSGLNNREGAYNLFNENLYYRDMTMNSDTVNQQSSSPQNGYNLDGVIAYTEPFNDNNQIMLSYRTSIQRNSFDQKTYNYNYFTDNFDLLDTLTSNIFDNDYLYNRGGLAYRYKTKGIYFSAGMDYQVASLLNDQKFPPLENLNYKFYNFLPSLMFRIGKNRMNSLYLHFRTSTSSPSVSQLQNVVDNSNPLQLSTGNPELIQQLNNSLFIRYGNFSRDFTKMFMTFISIRNSWNYIGQMSFLARNDTTINNTLILPAGGQVTMPVNLDGYWRAFAMMHYGFPLGFIKSKLDIMVGASYIRTPSLINNLHNYSNSYNYNTMLVLTSNISDNIDFNITSRINFNNTINTIQKNQNLNYFTWMNIANIKWIFWKGLFFEGDIRNVINGGANKPENADYNLLNLAVGTKLFDREQGELKLYFFDVLNNYKNVQTNLSDYYTENIINTTISNYVMLTFTYNLRNFGHRPKKY